MEILLIILGAAAVLFLPVGAIFGFLAYRNLNHQSLRINSLSREVNELREQVELSQAQQLTSQELKPQAPQPSIPISIPAIKTASASALAEAPVPANADNKPTVKPAAVQCVTSPVTSSEDQPQVDWQYQAPTPSPFMQSLKENWMVWLGGLSVALAGIFMVHYSVSEGLLGPVLQLLLALSVGAVLHTAAEYLRRRYERSDQIFAALAGGGSVTLYAALLAGIHHYQLIGPLLGLTLLAVVSLSTMVLARLHGPLLALMGLSGAYIVPLLIDSDAGSIAFVLSYSFLITFSSLLLMRFVFRDWLWYATLAGALLWWLAALFTPQAIAPVIGFEIPLYLAVLLAIFVLLTDKDQVGVRHLRVAILSLLLAWGVSIAGQASLIPSPQFWSWLLIWPVVLWLPTLKIPALLPVSVWASPSSVQQHTFWYLPWAAVLASALGWLAYVTQAGLDMIYLVQLPLELHVSFISYLLMSALLCIAVGWWQWRQQPTSKCWASFTLLSPLVWLSLGWILLHGIEPSIDWALGALLAATVYGALAKFLHPSKDVQNTGVKNLAVQNGAVWAVLASHISYALAVTMALREASLTQALAVQFVSLVWLARQYRIPQLYLLLKVVLAIVVARLTFNPWLASYELNQTLSPWNWVLWTYGGSALLAGIATYLSDRHHAIRPWLEAATLHLLVLFLGAELRYWLYDGDIFSQQYSFTEATINTLLWGGLSITYLLRGRVAQQLAWLYQSCALILLGLSSLSYLVLISVYNPWWGGTEISDTRLFNMLLPAYGGPVLLALALAIMLNRFPQLLAKLVAIRQWALAVAGGAFMLFSALEIRQLWRGSDMELWSGLALWPDMNNGELYTYSVVGMLYAIVGIIYATKKGYPLIYKAGMILLGLVIAKIFLIDMDGLQGLWRVSAFMGLGLALLGLAWMHQKVQRAVRAVPSA
ncbi:hypothetical protein CBP31_12025 [Oceanisphaera profunda]|uniref:DUF2339 domain-containing protein n=1 Tax=Oceanisphaera profunda TaxID=1416627 RepID=A0A1Y0D7R7_9GAMM|nr:DUF2339 domain-containing protein [Oceanisphaera profunda]ART83257.1 hypothetical protein CBP31_12025 [Oceanisphaera profunda]